MVRHFWSRGSFSLIPHFVKQEEAMLCQCEQRKLWHVRAEDEEERQAEISTFEKASEALREMNLVGDSISGAQGSLAHY